MFTLVSDFSKARAAVARIPGLLHLGSTRTLSGNGPSTGTIVSSRVEDDVEAKIESMVQSPKSNVNKGVGVQFQNVDFDYPARPDMRVLNGMDFEITPAGWTDRLMD
ncbi:hypothetical protein BDY21DRAFT_393605 [Lineolata rhizophorae]|uniref:Uncharacterized protein n=1 Tax=Lineolata rhizophorae TaxID=578093 RepID=A0A6A6NXA3_9PEZI|nr:hypothetical protein BDY21DRAFT_393605 [Lineolata rhizophorae]